MIGVFLVQWCRAATRAHDVFSVWYNFNKNRKGEIGLRSRPHVAEVEYSLTWQCKFGDIIINSEQQLRVKLVLCHIATLGARGTARCLQLWICRVVKIESEFEFVLICECSHLSEYCLCYPGYHIACVTRDQLMIMWASRDHASADFSRIIFRAGQENMRGQRGTLRALAVICHSH